MFLAWKQMFVIETRTIVVVAKFFINENRYCKRHFAKNFSLRHSSSKSLQHFQNSFFLCEAVIRRLSIDLL
jgi:hypothetical protein